MTKSHILLYALAVLGITISAYLYTSIAEAPHGLTLSEESQVVEALDTPKQNDSAFEASASPTLPVASEEESDEPVLLPVLPPVQSAASLENTTWQWLHITDRAGTITFTPKRPEAFKMQFTSTRMSSATDCNTLGGSYQVVGSELTFGPLMSTLMYCDGSDEATYSAALGSASGFEIAGNQLLLLTTEGTILVFVSI